MASWSPAPPLRANARKAAASLASWHRPAAAAAAAGSMSRRKSIRARRSSRPISGSDRVAASRLLDDQPLGLHAGQRLADRRGRHPERAGQRVDVQAGAGFEVVVHQHVDEHVVHVVDERWAFDAGADPPASRATTSRGRCCSTGLPESRPLRRHLRRSSLAIDPIGNCILTVGNRGSYGAAGQLTARWGPGDCAEQRDTGGAGRCGVVRAAPSPPCARRRQGPDRWPWPRCGSARS